MGTTRTDLYDPADLELAAWAKALGHPARIAILRHLLFAPSCITGDLTEAVGLAQATVSQHLVELKKVGLIRGTVRGTAVNYCIDPAVWRRAAAALSQLWNSGPLLQDPCCPAPAAPIRWDVLEPIARAMAERMKSHGSVDLQFICTHNSRRSQMAHAWGHVCAAEWDLPVRVFSGGTEATACATPTVEALIRAGFTRVGSEPTVLQGPHGGPVALTSKRFDDPMNASDGFLALMTCSDADENCPYIPHALARFPLRYDDPKAFDGTDQEAAAYDATCDAVSQELRALFQRVVDLL